MDETIKLLVEKFDRYNFLTNMLPGAVLCMALEHFVGYKLLESNEWMLSVILFYFVGIVNNRFGSLVVESSLKRLTIFKFEPYEDYIKAEKIDKKIDVLNADNNSFRSYISVFLLSLLAFIFKTVTNYFPAVKEIEGFILIFSLLILFICAYHKQTESLRKRIKVALKNSRSI